MFTQEEIFEVYADDVARGGYKDYFDRMFMYRQLALLACRRRYTKWISIGRNQERKKSYMSAYNKLPYVKAKSVEKNRRRYKPHPRVYTWEQQARKDKVKLNPAQVQEIRELRIKNPTMSYKSIGKLYGVGITAVFNICKGNSWRPHS